MHENIDNWLVLSPGRTGSRVIVDVLQVDGKANNLDITCVSPSSLEIATLEKGHIYHSHTVTDIELSNSRTRIIISTRDLIETALSWCIVREVGYYQWYPSRIQRMHFFGENAEQKKTYELPKSFYIDPDLFKSSYNACVDFYASLSTYTNNNWLFIDYSEFSTNIENLAIILDIPIQKKDMSSLGWIPTKNPGEQSDWISNWGEIQGVGLTLPRYYYNLESWQSGLLRQP